MSRGGATVITALILVATLSLALAAETTLVSRLIPIVILGLSRFVVVILTLILDLILSLLGCLIYGMFESTSIYGHMSSMARKKNIKASNKPPFLQVPFW